MNKYQEYILKNLLNWILWNKDLNQVSSTEINDTVLNLKQLEDITITSYTLIIEIKDKECIDAIKIEYLDNDIWLSADLYTENFLKINIDFNKQISRLRISSPKNIFDAFELNIKYIFADKNAYYVKQKEKEEAEAIAKQNALNLLIKPEHKTGINLVNIYWDLVSDQVDTVVVNLYSISNNSERLIGKSTESIGSFKSITGLAFGEYCYEIIEYDIDKNEIARSEKIKFAISRPNYNHKPIVSNR